MVKESITATARTAKEKLKKGLTPIEGLSLLKETATKFSRAAETHIRLGIDPKYTDQQLRTTVALPKGTGCQVAVIAREKGKQTTMQALT